jgi:hypothetical protein
VEEIFRMGNALDFLRGGAGHGRDYFQRNKSPQIGKWTSCTGPFLFILPSI